MEGVCSIWSKMIQADMQIDPLILQLTYFYFAVVPKQYAFQRNLTWNFECWHIHEWDIYSSISSQCWVVAVTYGWQLHELANYYSTVNYVGELLHWAGQICKVHLNYNILNWLWAYQTVKPLEVEKCMFSSCCWVTCTLPSSFGCHYLVRETTKIRALLSADMTSSPSGITS